jgi:hypothetical protein
MAEESTAALAAKIVELKALVSELKGRVEGYQLTAMLAGKQSSRVSELAEKVGKLSAAVAASAPSEPALVWDGTDPAQLSELAKWVDMHLRVAYEAYTRPIVHNCWAHHPEALWELGNLWCEWRRIYEGEVPLLDASLNWHDRWLPGVLARLKNVMNGCIGECSLDLGETK